MFPLCLWVMGWSLYFIIIIIIIIIFIIIIFFLLLRGTGMIGWLVGCSILIRKRLVQISFLYKWLCLILSTVLSNEYR